MTRDLYPTKTLLSKLFLYSALQVLIIMVFNFNYILVINCTVYYLPEHENRATCQPEKEQARSCDRSSCTGKAKASGCSIITLWKGRGEAPKNVECDFYQFDGTAYVCLVKEDQYKCTNCEDKKACVTRRSSSQATHLM
ncbi:hypothetical protein BY996DRAFT_6420485 [Phakopsora pachyrhizi]|nr:hypothetical protein BY996DRAFT_6420485 [Phakopsora pachyrhizi]